MTNNTIQTREFQYLVSYTHDLGVEAFGRGAVTCTMSDYFEVDPIESTKAMIKAIEARSGHKVINLIQYTLLGIKEEVNTLQ